MFILERKMKIMLRTSWPRATADLAVEHHPVVIVDMANPDRSCQQISHKHWIFKFSAACL